MHKLGCMHKLAAIFKYNEGPSRSIQPSNSMSRGGRDWVINSGEGKPPLMLGRLNDLWIWR